MTLIDIYPDAVVAGDGIPLPFGDEGREYHDALEGAVMMDRSHEGRFGITGRDQTFAREVSDVRNAGQFGVSNQSCVVVSAQIRVEVMVQRSGRTSTVAPVSQLDTDRLSTPVICI